MANLLLYLVNLATLIVGYVLTGLALYTIAKRRGINKPWTAWVPVANVWLLGCISDQYRHVARGQVKNKRKSMLVLMIVMLVLISLVVGLAVSVLLDVGPYMPDELRDPNEWIRISSMSDSELEEYAATFDDSTMMLTPAVESGLIRKAVVMLVVALALLGVAIALSILEYMAYYDIFTSADPRNGMMYLVAVLAGAFMGIGLVVPVLLFIVRDKDFGMPPRGGQVIDVTGAYIPPQQM